MIRGRRQFSLVEIGIVLVILFLVFYSVRFTVRCHRAGGFVVERPVLQCVRSSGIEVITP